MARHHRMRALLPAAALLLGLGIGQAWASAPGASENTLFLPVWIAPNSEDGMPGAPALLNMPPGWGRGDAAVVLVPGGAWPPGVRDRLTAALIDAGAVVLEINQLRPGLPPEESLRTDLGDALATLQEGFGAGLVVAIGHDASGEAALGAVDLAAGTGRYAAGIALGPQPRFAAGQVSPEEGWELRAPMLCDLLQRAVPVTEPGFPAACRQSLALLR